MSAANHAEDLADLLLQIDPDLATLYTRSELITEALQLVTRLKLFGALEAKAGDRE